MSRRRLLILFLVTGLAAVTPAINSSAAVNLSGAVKNIASEDASVRGQAFNEVLQAGIQGVEELTKMLVEPGKGDDAGVRFAVHGLAVHVTRPGAKAERAAFVRVLVKQLNTDLAVEVKRFLMEQLQIAGREEAVPTLAAFLMDEHLGETARQALLANPTPAAVKALRDALPRTKGALKVGTIQALGIRKDTMAAQALLAEASSPDPAVRKAASEALRRMGLAR